MFTMLISRLEPTPLSRGLSSLPGRQLRPMAVLHGLVCVYFLYRFGVVVHDVYTQNHHDLHRPQEDHLQHLLGGSRHRSRDA